jgi:outer membrane protein OmpA-like peptidoglycan-associated protein
MSSTTTTYTSHSESSRTSTGVPSKLILLLAGIFAILFSLADINWHGHWSCKTLQKHVMERLRQRTHLAEYLVDQTIPGTNEKEAGTVVCKCTELNKIVLQGKVVNADIRREFSDIAAAAVGTNRVDNQLEILNEPELQELQKLLQATGVTMNYQVKDRGTIYLTGDLPNPEMKDQITALVKKIHGVRGVVNDMGKELVVQKMLRIHSIWFDFNEWKIREPKAGEGAPVRVIETQKTLDEIAQRVDEFLASSPKGKIRIEGHTDSVDTDDYNLWLSDMRAKSVRDALIARGIPPEALTPLGKGEKSPVASNETPEGRADNRRIEFYFD